jgi:predicted transposase YdaD
MPEDDIHQPHDKLFRAAFSDPETAAAFLQAYLDAELVALVDWGSLHVEAGTFIDAQMKSSAADLLFTAKVHGEDAHFYFLCEHQSSEDRLMPLRVLAYMVRIWTEEAKSTPGSERLTPIIPVVVAQDDKVWKTSTKFHDLFQLPPQKWAEVRSFMPDFSFLLLQLVELPFESIAGTADGKLALRALKAQAVGELLGDPVWDHSLLRTVSAEVLDYLIRYVWNQDVDKERFWLKLKELPRTDLNPETMTLAQKIREEGRVEGRVEGREEGRVEGLEEGREEGREEGMRHAIWGLLKIRFETVHEGLREELDHISNMERLEALHRQAVCCASLEEFAAAL